MHILAANVEPQRGWGNLIAIAVVGLLFWAFTAALGRWQQTQADTAPATSSAETTAPAPGGVKPQVSASSDPTFDPTPEEAGEEAQERPTALAQWAKTRAGKPGYRAAVRTGAAKFRRSEATVKRALRKARGGAAS